MSKTEDTYIPAFPFEFTDKSQTEFDGQQFADMGMSLRDYFAAKAITGYVSGDASWNLMDKVAAAAYTLADAMLAEREK